MTKSVRSGVGKFITRRARFGKTVETAGSTLSGKQGEDLFPGEIAVHVRMRSQNKRLSPRFSRFLFQVCTVEVCFFENHCHP